MAELFLLLFVMSVVFGIAFIVSGIVGMLCSLFTDYGPSITILLLPLLFVAFIFIAVVPLFNAIGSIVFSY